MGQLKKRATQLEKFAIRCIILPTISISFSGITAFSLLSKPALSFVITPPSDIVKKDTATEFLAIIEGGTVTPGSGPFLFDLGDNWNLDISIGSPSVPENILLIDINEFRHIAAPHNNEDSPNPNFYLDNLTLEPENGITEFSKIVSRKHPSTNHLDIFKVEGSGTFNNVNQITSWKVTFSAIHSVPEPNTVLGLFAVCGLGLGLKCRKQW